MSSSSAAARVRGIATGLLTATLAVAAHGMAGGALPSGAATVHIAVLAATVGALAATLSRASEARVQMMLLAGGQLTAHVLLSAVGHHHAVSPAPPASA